MAKNKFIPDPNQDPEDYDRNNYIRVFKGRFTKARYKALARFVRAFTEDMGFCGHDYDCCGCLHRKHAHLEIISHDEIVVKTSYLYNY